MDQNIHAKIGDALLAAYDSGQPIAPPSEHLPSFTMEDAYAIQRHQVTAWRSAGRRVRGYKVGLTSLAMQRQLGVDQPDFGHLFNDMVLDSYDPIASERFIAPKVEPEISFVLRRDLTGPGLSIVDAIDAVDYAVASLEIIDSRIADWRITLPDTIADNASSGALVLGGRPVRLEAAELSTIGCVLYRNGAIEQTGAGGAVLGNPLNGLVWLGNTLGSFGQTLEAGSIVMAGALTAAVAARPGDTFTATFAQLGSVSARFADKKESSS